MAVSSRNGTDRSFETSGVDAVSYDRYDQIRIDDGQVLIYDRDEEDGWLQSTLAVDLEVMR
ncbi:hypothetical protein L593_03720 [Salinarchaeum sp. Harcht-Bsk1]|uniref:hypothetical protein n=1 Tax=Salinarchaeum sp. Harcht-Bsk1 TaxID=1333523 RepID=UPI00034248D5|nr:hypothetical protein [Salinarchaeum sp. Harcht-Bsk1]AGN00695.1 hypothetical protein L593_03720 [Salinarchaeum sp. Harcht-Bsk1]